MTELIGPPAGWSEIPGLPSVMSNLDHDINEAIARQLTDGGCWARHAAWDFNGRVWHDGGRWHEQVWVYGAPVAAYSADTLEELMKTVNDEYGGA